ncbi:peptidoglycan editing factor PgeF [Clostridium cavendishii]|nr:peptidoglycan editing factor PgeF [Clostridium cavendishii]
MKIVNGDIKIKNDKINIYFTTAEASIDYKIGLGEGEKSINILENKLNLKKIYFLKQIHSDKIINTNDINNDLIVEGDALISNKRDIGIGVFTADCVPVIAYDKEKEIIAAIHSGWRGTYDNIVGKTIDKMIKDYGCSNIETIIGPHIKECCYEVSMEIVDKFNEKYNYKTKSRNISIESYIKEQLEKYNEVKKIDNVNLCTFCSDKPKFYSYRKEGDLAGRMFSFIFLN